ncbi:small secreted protein [Streptomyces pactum]|uniref:small secreted protein n=1 Tax=Streptomyces pactum TaxID=68249 RepID=UPI0027DAC84C|nr:small secreted protein [Streptomyces pactum]
MNKKLMAALSGGAALVLALSGCSDGDDGEKKVDAWAKEVCDAAQPQLKNILEASTAIEAVTDEQDPKKYQEASSTAYQKISDGYAALAKAVQKAGAPPVDGGEKSQTEAVKGLNAASQRYAALKTSVDELNTGDKGEFAQGLREIQEEPPKIVKAATTSMKNLQGGELGQAMAQQPGCQKVADSVSPAS